MKCGLTLTACSTTPARAFRVFPGPLVSTIKGYAKIAFTSSQYMPIEPESSTCKIDVSKGLAVSRKGWHIRETPYRIFSTQPTGSLLQQQVQRKAAAGQGELSIGHTGLLAEKEVGLEAGHRFDLSFCLTMMILTCRIDPSLA